ncbi:hypothetical protein JQK88_34410 [Mesorhizobium caraganae]|uniref:hypothetical protein n=1 Tax=Mesorhizobium caraganae TaxID=483206 RepID=UPI001939E4E0|nr:hypothetical protein [Mesorhizobium caraganae]MBM2716169.1 hypothetical protein [Mesorhizobium caraganae]
MKYRGRFRRDAVGFQFLLRGLDFAGAFLVLASIVRLRLIAIEFVQLFWLARGVLVAVGL